MASPTPLAASGDPRELDPTDPGGTVVVILKYQWPATSWAALRGEDPSVIDVPWWPGLSRILHVDDQGGTPTVWVAQPRGHGDEPPASRRLHLVPTGMAFGADPVEYIGTLLQPQFGLVWHVWALRKVTPL